MKTGFLVALMALLFLVACAGATPTALPPPTSPVPSTSATGVPQLSDVLERMQLVSPAVEQVQSAIVSITVESGNQNPSALPRGIRGGTRYGSGVIFDRQGLILTNSQLIQDAGQATVTLLGGSQLEAEVVGTDLLSGLAVLRIPGNDYPFLPLDSSAEVRVGDLVIAVGNSSTAPMGSTVVSAGVVSVLGRSIEVPPGVTLFDLIQTDINATPNHNGAPLINLAGELVGIIVEAVDGQFGISFAIGMDAAAPIARQLAELGRVRRPYLGVFFSSSSQEVVVSISGGESTPVIRPSSPEEPIVGKVIDGGAAAQAGIKPGDLLVSLGGHEVASTDDVRRLLRQEFEVGQEIEVVVTRDGETQTFQLVLGERPTPTPLSIRPPLSECKVASDADVETGSRATQPPTMTVEIPTIQGDYSSQQIKDWRQEAEAAVFPLGLVWSSWIDEKRNRIFFTAYTSYAAGKARDAIAKTSVPIDAVIFEVDPKRRLDDPPAQIDSPMGISISLEFQRSVALGQPVLIELVLTNEGDDAVEVDHGVPFYEDVLVFTSVGDQVWKKLRGPIAPVGGSTRLEAGEQIRLETLWEQRDLDGFVLPPGCYLVRGTAGIADAPGAWIDLATEPYELVILP